MISGPLSYRVFRETGPCSSRAKLEEKGELGAKWRMIFAVNFPIILSNWKEEALKTQGFNGTRTRDLRDTGAMLYQLS